MRRIVLLIILVLLLLPANTNADKHDFNKLRFQALGISGLFAYLAEDKVEKVVVPETACTCKGKGKISLDGGGSWMKCPCLNCDCSKSAGESADVPVIEEVASVRSYLQDYYVMKFTADWCGPCKIWERDVAPEIESLLTIERINIDKNKRFKVGQIPQVWICTKGDKLYHKAYQLKGNLSKVAILEAIDKLQTELHPAKQYYVAQTTRSWNIDDISLPPKSVLLYHLKHEVKHKAVKDWPLDDLSWYELMAIHKDSHNGKLGELYDR